MILTSLAHESVNSLLHVVYPSCTRSRPIKRVTACVNEFMVHGGLITGAVKDAKPRRSPIPSGGQEIKLRQTFRAVAPLADKMKVLLRQQYNFEFDGQQQGDINNDNGGDISDNEN